MDIVFLTDQVVRAGAETQMIRLAVTLQQRGWRVGVISMLPADAFEEDLRLAGIPLFHCSHGMPLLKVLPLRLALALYRQLRRWQPAFLVTFNYHSDIMGRIVGRLAGIQRVVGTLRTAHVKTWFRKLLYRQTERLVDLTVSNSQAAVRYMVDRHILKQHKTEVIPNGISLDAFPSIAPTPAERALLPAPEGCFTWLAVGNLRPAKDYPTLLASVRECAASPWPFHLFIAGEGPLRPALEEEIARLGLADRVTLLGLRTDVPQLLRASDGFVLSSAWEGMPNTVMEAMAAGLPVVSTDAGGVRELILQGECGWIVRCGDAQALAERMVHVMGEGREEGRGMGRAGRERMQRLFSHAQVADRWESLLNQLMGARRGDPREAGGIISRQD
jgi:glycosyltransferase involved in cell wall biosynthesis